MIPPFSLASNPSKKTQFREATVSDALDFSEINDQHDEEVTTLFLNRIQSKHTFIDAKKWTAEDRRLGLFWYWMHTAKDHDLAITYECDHCGQRHTFLLNMVSIAEGYKPIQGEPVREFSFDGHTVIVRPLNGEHMEELEVMNVSLDDIKAKHGETSGAYRKQLNKIKLLTFILLLENSEIGDSDKPKRDRVEDWILSMSGTRFSDLVEQVEAKVAEMEHGLKSETDNGKICLLSPPHVCPKDKEAETLLRVPFRVFDYIPYL